MHFTKGIARIFWGGGGVVTLCHIRVLTKSSADLRSENGVCNYLALENIYGLYVVYLKKLPHKGGGGVTGARGSPSLAMLLFMDSSFRL